MNAVMKFCHFWLMAAIKKLSWQCARTAGDERERNEKTQQQTLHRLIQRGTGGRALFSSSTNPFRFTLFPQPALKSQKEASILGQDVTNTQAAVCWLIDLTSFQRASWAQLNLSWSTHDLLSVVTFCLVCCHSFSRQPCWEGGSQTWRSHPVSQWVGHEVRLVVVGLHWNRLLLS